MTPPADRAVAEAAQAPARHVVSLGAGVQSTTLVLMAAHGEIKPMPECAIFADTTAEPAAVYEHLAWLRSPNVLPFPVHIVSAGDLRAEIHVAARGEQRNDARPPFFIRNRDGSRGVLRRQCTGDYKIDPIHRALRDLVGLRPGQRGPKSPAIMQWIGISLDEVYRVKASRVRWIEHRWPLIDLRMKRWDCLQWLRRHGYPEPPKSACTFCPYRSDAEWRRIRDTDPAAWRDAVEVDRVIRAPGYVGLVGEAYLHGSLRPLDEVDLSTQADRGQADLMLQECEGMCGV